MDYRFTEIEQKWRKYWAENNTYKTIIDKQKPKCYVLDMFPYPSGAGLHVGHPLGYIASDIYARYKRLKGFNVLHPMGYDSFGLPAEQYAIQTGQHPSVTTETNIATYREQLDRIGLSFDWGREIRTSSAEYYKWTQWIVIQLFDSWYNQETNQAEAIETLIHKLENSGTSTIKANADEDCKKITAQEWNSLSENKKEEELLKYRLVYLRESTVNWCPGLGTVLANDEVKDGFSERGGFPVEQKKMMQWSMRITAYANRLLEGLNQLDWPDPVKEMQRNWIGKSVGASIKFQLADFDDSIEVFTTRIDTLFGVSFLVLAPEHELVKKITKEFQIREINNYIQETSRKSERDRMSEVKIVSGAFTGSYAKHPFNDELIPVYIADYVLAGYGTGAVMAVPSGDQRDYLFAKKYNLPIISILTNQNTESEADATKEGTYINSGFINGLNYQEALAALILEIERKQIGKAQTNFRIRDAIFGRQRYWGEPMPIYFEGKLPKALSEDSLPLLLPEIDLFLPTETGEPPLARAKDWNFNGKEYELSTMPGWAGSSWYWYRYMDAKNDLEFASKESIDYWQDVDLYIGGSEHATGHLLYSRFWNKFLKDRGWVAKDEPFKKLINQGMIQGRSNFVYRVKGNSENPVFVTFSLKNDYETSAIHVDVSLVNNDELNQIEFRNSRAEYKNAEFITENGKYVCGSEIEKMSKSKFNVVNPDDLIERYGADTLRLYEMFLGPLEQSKPWNTNGIEGVFKFLRKFWKLFHDDEFSFSMSESAPSKDEFKALHKMIKKAEDDVERFSFNTSVSNFMICVNELTAIKCNKKEILQPLIIILSPYAPHICEELWELCGNQSGTLSKSSFPIFNPEYLVESEFNYPISMNGKVKMNLNFSLDLENSEIEKMVLANEEVRKYLDGKSPKKVIVVKGKIVNVVV